MQERIHLNCPDSVRFRGVLITVTKVRFPLQQDFSWSGDKAWLLKQSPVPSISLFVGCHMAIGTVYLCMSYIQIMWKPNGIMKACTYAGVFPLVMFFFWHRSDSWRSRESRVHVDHLHLYHLRCYHCDKLQGDTTTPSGESKAGTWGSPEERLFQELMRWLQELIDEHLQKNASEILPGVGRWLRHGEKYQLLTQ